MSLAYLFFMAEGVLGAIQLRRTEAAARVAALDAHLMMQLRAVVLALLGAGIIFFNKVSVQALRFRAPC
jgi:hypothetical protein